MRYKLEIIPAIDLRNGKCVRLYQGDYAKETVFSADPVAVARRWESEGAPRLHVVDLDGAAGGELRNLPAIEKIVKAINIPVQVGGGIRALGTVEQLLALGVKRVVLGTAAVENEAMVSESCRRCGEAIIVGIDARDGFVATRGWKESSQVRAGELAQRMASLGVKRIIYTDISRDGTLTQPNFEAIAELVSLVAVPVIASGGVAKLEHLTRLARLGVEGAIIGRALYTGDVRLGEAISAVH